MVASVAFNRRAAGEERMQVLAAIEFLNPLPCLCTATLLLQGQEESHDKQGAWSMHDSTFLSCMQA